MVEHGRVQRRQRSLGCFATSRPRETQTRGLQPSLNARMVVRCAKVSGSGNPADVCTKDLNAELITEHVTAVEVDSCDAAPGRGNPVEQCCRLKDRHPREQCKSNRTTNCKVRGGV